MIFQVQTTETGLRWVHRIAYAIHTNAINPLWHAEWNKFRHFFASDSILEYDKK